MKPEDVDFCPYCAGDIEITTRRTRGGKQLFVVKCPNCGDVYGEDADEEKAVKKFKNRAYYLYNRLKEKRNELKALTRGWRWYWRGSRR